MQTFGERYPYLRTRPELARLAAMRIDESISIVVTPEAKVQVPTPETLVLTVADQVRLARLRHACPHASPPSCGCSDLVQCGLGKGDAGQADRATCFGCLAAKNPARPD